MAEAPFLGALDLHFRNVGGTPPLLSRPPYTPMRGNGEARVAGVPCLSNHRAVPYLRLEGFLGGGIHHVSLFSAPPLHAF